VQADTVVPGVGDSQAWDRYAYSMNNPVKYIDPSGHDYELWHFDKYGILPSNREKTDHKFDNALEGFFQSGEPIVIEIGEIVIVIMPEGSQLNFNRSELEQRLGLALVITGEYLDIGELIEIFLTGGSGGPDITALWDVIITQIGTWLKGESPFIDEIDKSIPPLIGTNQDVLVQFGDFSIALIAKGIGASAGGPAGYVAAVVVDMITTAINLIYDENRNFGTLENHIVIGIPVCSDCVDQWGKTYIVLLP